MKKIVWSIISIVSILATILIYIGVHVSNNSIDHYNAGVDFDAKHETDKAIAEYREAIQINNDNSKAHDNLGVDLRRKGQTDEAIPEFRAAIKADNNNLQAHLNLG